MVEAEIAKLREDGMSIRKIAAEAGFSKATVQKALTKRSPNSTSNISILSFFQDLPRSKSLPPLPFGLISPEQHLILCPQEEIL